MRYQQTNRREQEQQRHTQRSTPQRSCVLRACPTASFRRGWKNTGIAVLCLLMACNGNADQKKPIADTTAKPASQVELTPEIHTELYGNYVGDFVPADDETDGEAADITKINIMITRITGNKIEAHSVVKGNDRPMNGTFTAAGDKLSIVADEPGSDKHDGRFSFYVKGDSIIGSWTAFDPTVKGPKKTFALVKKPFQYNSSLMLPKDWEYVDYTHPKEVKDLYKNEDGTVDTIVNSYYRYASDKVYTLNASKTQLTEAQLKNLKKLDLEIIRNTIFARHGYSFKKKSVRQFFDGVEWYVPVTNNIDSLLTPVEKGNVALLQRFEKYATDNYDSFGR